MSEAVIPGQRRILVSEVSVFLAANFGSVRRSKVIKLVLPLPNLEQMWKKYFIFKAGHSCPAETGEEDENAIPGE